MESTSRLVSAGSQSISEKAVLTRNRRYFEQNLTAPLTVSWEVTYACNLECIHCLSSSGEKRGGELTLTEAERLMDELSELKVFYVYIGGGEPLMRRDMYEILRYGEARGLMMPISTNGTLVNEELVRKLSKLTNIRLQVSLDGASATTHDKVRGRGSFERAIKCLGLLKKHAVPFYVSSVLTRLNIRELDALYGLANSYGAKLRVQRLRPSGRGEDSWGHLHPIRRQYLELHEWLLEHDDVLTADSFFFLNALEPRLKGFSMCSAGKMVCLISPDGFVYPCPFIQSQELIAGSIREQPLATIWRESEVFKQFRRLEMAECEDCSAYESCHGGCRATAYAVRRSLEKPDAECMRGRINDTVKSSLRWSCLKEPLARVSS